jgi:hypothetical protein
MENQNTVPPEILKAAYEVGQAAGEHSAAKSYLNQTLKAYGLERSETRLAFEAESLAREISEAKQKELLKLISAWKITPNN